MKGIEEKQIEAPYELPEGWKWCRLGDFINIFRGVSYKKNDAHNEKQENDCLIIRGGNIDEGCINLNSDNVFVNKSLVSENQIIKKNDVIIVTSTGSIKVIGRAGVSASDYEDVAFGAFLTLARPNEKANKSFVNQYFQSSLYRERIRQLASGVNINNIRIEYITESPFPLPPTLAEQQRIVNRIESMFAKLDEAKEKAQNVVDGFETRKAAILHKAFTGELTAKWRKENGVSDDSWEKNFLKDICSKITDGTHNSPVNTETGDFKYITAKNIKESGIDLTNITFVSKEVHQEIYARCNVEKGDVLYIKDGATTGIAAVNTLDEEFSMLSSVADLKPINGLLDSKYLAYVLNSSEIKAKMLNEMSGNAITRLTLVKIKKSEIPVCSFSEQVEIVRILDIIIEKENKAKQAAEAVLEQIDLLKKSILARAFRGEL